MEIYNGIADPVFGGLVVSGVPLLAVVFGLVQFLKETFTIDGKPVRVMSLLTGLLLGTGYRLSVTPPNDFAGWFGTIIFGLTLGLVASGIYKGVKQAASGVGEEEVG